MYSLNEKVTNKKKPSRCFHTPPACSTFYVKHPLLRRLTVCEHAFHDETKQFGSFKLCLKIWDNRVEAAISLQAFEEGKQDKVRH